MKKNFSIKLTKPIVGKRYGVFQHIMKWTGSEKVDMRKYSAGDSSSQINRRLSAKYQELYTNIFQQEKSLVLDMFLDINYNRRGGKVPNEQQVIAYAEDIISYCQHEQIAIRFFSPKQKLFGSTQLVEQVMSKNNQEILDTLHTLVAGVKKTKKIYTSLLQTFLTTSTERQQRRAIVIFSDFLTMDEESKKLLHYLRAHHIVFLFQLPIDHQLWQNYTWFFVEKNSLPVVMGAAENQSDEIELLQVD